MRRCGRKLFLMKFLTPLYRFDMQMRCALFLILYCLMLPVYGSGSDMRFRKNSVDIIRSTLSEEKQKFRRYHSHERDMLGQLSLLEKEVAREKKLVEKCRNRLVSGNRRILAMKCKLEGIEKSIEDFETKMAKRLVSMYKYARSSYAAVLLNTNDSDEMWKRFKYLKYVVKEDINTLSSLAREKALQENRLVAVRSVLKHVQDATRIEAERLSALKKDLEKKVIRLVDIHRKKEFYETAVTELEISSPTLKKAMQQIEKKETYHAISAVRFETLKGKLPLPVEGGEVVMMPLAAGTSSCKGVFIQCALGSDGAVRTVASGRVDFSGRLKGYGNVIIINHGARYYTVFAHLSERYRAAGDKIRQGDVIGLAERFSPSGTARIYFEIRKGRNGLNPLTWLKDSRQCMNLR